MEKPADNHKVTNLNPQMWEIIWSIILLIAVNTEERWRRDNSAIPDSAADRGSEYMRFPKKEKDVMVINLDPLSNNVKHKTLRGISHFSGEYENQGSPGSPLPDGTT